MDQKAYRIGDEPLDGASQSFMQSSLPNDLVSVVKIFMHESCRAGFDADETSIILNGYLIMGKESPLYYLEETEIQGLFEFLMKLKWSTNWSDDDVEKFQMMIMTDPAKSGILEVFKHHNMYKRIDSAGSADILQPTGQFKNTYYLDSSSVKRLIHGDLNVSGDRLILSKDAAGRRLTTHSDAKGGNDNNTLLDDPSESGLEESDDNLFEGYENPYFVHNSVVYDQNDLENVPMKIGFDGMIYVFSMEATPNTTIDLASMFSYLRSFRVDAKCTMVLTIGGPDKPHSFCKRIVAKPGNWINFAELMLPYNDLYLPIRLRLVPKEAEELDDINLQIMGVFLKPEAYNMFCKDITSKPPNPYNYGFRPYFTLIQ